MVDLFANMPPDVRHVVEEETEVGREWFGALNVRSVHHVIYGLDHKVAQVRRAIWFRLYDHRPEPPERRLSYAKIGRLFEKDHTTVRDGIIAHLNENMVAWSAAKNRRYTKHRGVHLTAAAEMCANIVEPA